MERGLTQEIFLIVCYYWKAWEVSLADSILVLMARKNDVESESGINSMLLYHATIIIHGRSAVDQCLIGTD